MTDLTIPDEAQESALQAVIDVRDAAPRVPDDADSFDVTMAALRAAAPFIVRDAVAAELRRIAADYKKQADRERERSLRLGRNGAPKWQHESSIASAQELAAFVTVLTARADALDPEGATR